MGQKLEGSQLELYRRSDEILHYIWDPIGIRGEIGARDEYDGYLPQVFSLLTKGADVESISAYLSEVEEKRMGLAVTEDSLLHAKGVAQTLLEWKNHLTSRASS